ncbi:MAG: aldose 1-epimerase [Alistipes sp.]|nr:aldose 1-epimerase [Alistipes sp.]
MIRRIDWNGLSAVEFTKGDYTALLIPEVGANLVRLANTRLGVEILRTPSADEIETFKSRPQIFGLPLLFPPNRIEDGRYTFNGREYQYPITIEKEHNYHHGIIKGLPFVVSKAYETDEEVVVETRYYSNVANDAIYRDFPHEFKCKIEYKLSYKGLKQEVVFSNRSRTPMPIGVGFHTPMLIPFAGGEGKDYTMRVSVGEQCELSERNLPTGRRLPLDEKFSKLRNGGLQVTDCEAIEAGFTNLPIMVDGEPYCGAVVENLRTGVRTFYQTDDKTFYWTVWNNGGNQPYCCPEPQSWITNAPNAADPFAAGFRTIAPGDKWKMKFKLYAK